MKAYLIKVWEDLDPRYKDHIKSAAQSFMAAFIIVFFAAFKDLNGETFKMEIIVSLFYTAVRAGIKALFQDLLGWSRTDTGVPFGSRKK